MPVADMIQNDGVGFKNKEKSQLTLIIDGRDNKAYVQVVMDTGQNKLARQAAKKAMQIANVDSYQKFFDLGHEKRDEICKKVFYANVNASGGDENPSIDAFQSTSRPKDPGILTISYDLRPDSVENK